MKSEIVMKISVIVAVSSNQVIGNKNKLPWHLSADLKYFKRKTMGHPVIMGRKTHESIGRPLPGRTNIVITRKLNYELPGCIVVNSLPEAINLCTDEEEVFVIGGAEVILQAIDDADRVYLTLVHQEFEGDSFLPPFNMNLWHEISREDHQADQNNAYNYSFIVLEKRNK